ncbi:MAG: hypothetical protein K6E97_11065 [Treponema sp.]|nr:hypothetical protein [Treponema sp.]
MKKLITLLSAAAILLALTSCGTTKVEPIEGWTEMEVPAGKLTVIDRAEEDLIWKTVAGDSSTAVSISKKWKWDFKKSVLCEFKAIEENGKAGYECTKLPSTDWSAFDYVTIKVNNPNAYDLYLSVSAEAAGKKGTTVNISDSMRCPPGVHTIVFNISSFKDTSAVQKFFVIQNAKATEGKFFMDSIMLISSDPSYNKNEK